MKKALLLGFALLFVVACGQEELIHNLEERTANDIIVLLEQSGISAEKLIDESQKKVIRYKVVVPKEFRVRAWNILQEKGIPRTPPGGLQEVFSAGSLIPTVTEERAKYLMALQGEIEKTLSEINGVVAVRVHLVLPNSQPDQPDAKDIQPKASVFLKYYQGLSKSRPFSEADIQNLVSGAVNELDAKDVEVIMNKVQAVELAGKQEINMAKFLFFTVSAESKRGIQIFFALMLAAVIMALFMVVFMFFKLRDVNATLRIYRGRKKEAIEKTG